MRDIGKNIRELRIKKNMTQDELAEKLFVTRQTVSNYETGKSRPDIDVLVKLSELLGCDINSLLYGPPAEPERKAEYRALIIGIVICVLSGLPFIFWVDFHKMARHFQDGVTITLRYLVFPLFLVVLGWTVMQAIILITRPRKLNQNVCKRLYWVLFSVILLYFVLQLQIEYHYIKAARVYSYMHSHPMIPPYGIRSVFDIEPQWLDMFSGYFFLFTHKNRWLFFALGFSCRLFKTKEDNLKVHVVILLSALLLSLIIFLNSNSSFTLEVVNPEDYTNPPYGIVVEQWTDE